MHFAIHFVLEGNLFDLCIPCATKIANLKLQKLAHTRTRVNTRMKMVARDLKSRTEVNGETNIDRIDKEWILKLTHAHRSSAI